MLVVNPAMADDMRELVGCRPVPGGGWEFHWSWGDPIGPAVQLTDAANVIFRVLRVVAGEPVVES